MTHEKVEPLRVILKGFLKESQVAVVLHVPRGHNDRRVGPHGLAAPRPYPGVIVQREPVARSRVRSIIPLLIPPVVHGLAVERGHVVHVQARGRVGDDVAAVLDLLAVGTIGLYAEHVAVHGILDELVPPVDADVAAAKMSPFGKGRSICQRVNIGWRLGGATNLRKPKGVGGEMGLSGVGETSLLRGDVRSPREDVNVTLQHRSTMDVVFWVTRPALGLGISNRLGLVFRSSVVKSHAGDESNIDISCRQL
mmetsp:Transcript_21005/g.50650  ORF Transcript_21005/g.50650 Transcript_21005/m.50650 type:complete len:252 (+) Transcript_21005:1047-1802(+)